MKKRSLGFRKSKLILLSLVCLALAFLILIIKIRPKRKGGDEKHEERIKEIEKFLLHHDNFHDGAFDGSDSLRFYKEWECDYCKKIIDLPWKDKVKIMGDRTVIGNDSDNQEKSSREPSEEEIKRGNIILSNSINCAVAEHLRKCDEVKKNTDFLNRVKDNNLTYDDKKRLEDKGYCYEAINQVNRWDLLGNVILPDLKEQKRKGIVKVLEGVSKKGAELIENNMWGIASDLIIFLTPRSTPITRQNLPELLKREQKSNFFYTVHGSKNTAAHEKIVASFFVWRTLQKEKEWNYNIYLLEDGECGSTAKYRSIAGNSAGVVWYLSLLSAYYQKPISREVASTAAIDVGELSDFSRWVGVEEPSCFSRCVQCFQEDRLAKNMEKNFSQNKITPIGALLTKVKAAIQDGVKKLILSTEQKEDYEKNIPPEIKEKLTVYYVKNVEELESLFWKGEFS